MISNIVDEQYYNKLLEQSTYKLSQNGFFMIENFWSEDICDSISQKFINLLDNDIDKTITKEYKII